MLTNEERVELIQNGIDTVDNMQLLYEQNKWFIYKIVKKLTMFSDIEDLMQESYFGLDQAVKGSMLHRGQRSLHMQHSGLSRY